MIVLRNQNFRKHFLSGHGKSLFPAQANFDFDEEIGLLRCGHRYHFKCITEWINFDGKNCPLCRTNIKHCQNFFFHLKFKLSLNNYR